MRPTLQELKELLDYDCISGEFTWKERFPSVGDNARFNRFFAWQRAGSLHTRANGTPHRTISVLGYGMPASKLAWAFHHNEWPTERVFHRFNGDDDSIANLYQKQKESFAIIVTTSTGRVIELERFNSKWQANQAAVQTNISVLKVR